MGEAVDYTERARAFWDNMRHYDEYDIEDIESLAAEFSRIAREERERCAKIADQRMKYRNPPAVAAAIRSLNWPEDTRAALRSTPQDKGEK